MALWKQYLKELDKEINRKGTWEPTKNIALGDYGPVVDGEFRPFGNIKDLGIQFEPFVDPSPGNSSFSSQRGTKVTFKASGEAAPAGSALKVNDAGIVVEFTKEGSVLFAVKNEQDHSIKNIAAVGQQIVELCNDKKWNKDHVVITVVKHVEDMVVLISKVAGFKVDLNVKVAATPIDLKAAAGATIATASEQYKSYTADKATPILEAIRIKDGPFSRPRPVVHNITRSMSGMKSVDDVSALITSWGEFEYDLED